MLYETFLCREGRAGWADLIGSTLLLAKANAGLTQEPQEHWIPIQLQLPTLCLHLGHAIYQYQCISES